MVKFVLQLSDILYAEVKNGGGESCVSSSFAKHLDKVECRSRASGGNDRNRDCFGHAAH